MSSFKEDSKKQRSITLIELMVAIAYLAIVVSVAVYEGKKHGVWGVLAGLSIVVCVPIALYLLRSWRPAIKLFDLMLPLIPLIVVGAYLLRPELYFLRLAAIAAVLVIGDFLFQGLYTWIFYRGRKDSFTLHFGWFLFVVVVGTVLSIWWGWLSTSIVLLIDGSWQCLAAFVDRNSIERLPDDDEELKIKAKEVQKAGRLNI